MVRTIVGKGLESILALLVAVVLVFGLARVTGDPAKMVVSLEATTTLDADVLRRELGLEGTILEQFRDYIGALMRGDLGRSLYTRQPAHLAILPRILPSVTLSFLSVVFGLLIGTVATVSAKRFRFTRPLVSGLGALGQAVPSFLLALILVWLFALQWRILPVARAEGISSYVLPTLTLAVLVSAGVIRLLRGALDDASESGYAEFARSLGMSESRVVMSWALPNALLPVLSYLGFMFSTIIAGAIVVEVIFAWPGMGQLAYQATLARDFPLLQGTVLAWAIIVIATSLLTDILSAAIDPRLRLAE